MKATMKALRRSELALMVLRQRYDDLHRLINKEMINARRTHAECEHYQTDYFAWAKRKAEGSK